jgi:peptidoglycan glycosyltransferase
MNWRRITGMALLIASMVSVGFGMTRAIEPAAAWLVAIWLAAPLLLGALSLLFPPAPAGVAQSVRNLTLAMVTGFVIIAIQLLRQQFVHADALERYVYVDEQNGQTTSNLRPVLEALRVQRGVIADRRETPLVTSQVAAGVVTRTYPVGARYDGRAFGALLGYFTPRFGQSGLEASYGDYLDGTRDRLKQVQDTMLGRPRRGDDLHLTIDAALQDAAYRILGDRRGAVVVIEPRTGAIRALVSAPGFDPAILAYDPAADDAIERARIDGYWNALNSEAAAQPLLNRALQGSYPPGSIFKTITAVSALEHADVARLDAIECPEQLVVEAGAPPVVNAVPDLASRTGSPADLERVYAFSCNTAFAELALRLGADRLGDTAARFGIVAPTQAGGSPLADLPGTASLLYGEDGALTRAPMLADTGFGQGQLLVTPLQMALMAATIANDGVPVRPYLVERITRPDGTVIRQHAPEALPRATSSIVARRMRDLMRATVAYGFGGAADAVPGVAVGGKSGTAEYACPTADAPMRVCTHAWFIAIAPVAQPRYAVAVIIEDGGEGSSAGARAAGQVLAAAFALPDDER